MSGSGFLSGAGLYSAEAFPERKTEGVPCPFKIPTLAEQAAVYALAIMQREQMIATLRAENADLRARLRNNQ
jgi:hypothetical protein